MLIRHNIRIALDEKRLVVSRRWFLFHILTFVIFETSIKFVARAWEILSPKVILKHGRGEPNKAAFQRLPQLLTICDPLL